MKRRFVFCVVLIAFISNMSLPYGANAQVITPPLWLTSTTTTVKYL